MRIFCIRFCDNNFIVNDENFFGFWNVPDTKSLTLFELIKDFISKLGHNTNNLSSSCFYGAANISGGLQTLIRKNFSSIALCVRCYAHKLNLAVQAACSIINAVNDTIETAKMLYSYILKTQQKFS